MVASDRTNFVQANKCFKCIYVCVQIHTHTQSHLSFINYIIENVSLINILLEK